MLLDGFWLYSQTLLILRLIRINQEYCKTIFTFSFLHQHIPNNLRTFANIDMPIPE